MKLFLVILAGVLLSGCAYYPQQSGLPTGASKAEVQNLIGPPKSKSRDGALTTWNYGGGTVCVFKDDQLVASNYTAPAQSSSSFSIGSLLPPVSVNLAPAPYYSPAVYAAPAYYGGGWGGWGVPWWGYGWGGYSRPYWGYNNYHGYYRGNYYRGNYYRGNYNHGHYKNGNHH